MSGRLVTITATLIASASPALAGRPLTIDDAGTVAPGHVELEAGLAWARSPGADRWDLPGAVTPGIAEHLEAGIGFGYQWERLRGNTPGEDQSTWDDLSVSPKWQFAQQATALLDQALTFTLRIPVADPDTGLGSGHPDYDLTWIGTRQIAQAWAADLNVGYTYTTGSDAGEKIADFIHYGIATRYGLSERWEPVAEIFARTTTDGEHETNVFGDVGIRYHPNMTIQFDAAVGTTLSGDGPDLFATTGLTLYF